MSQKTYKSVAREIYPETEGAQLEQVENAVRDSVIHACVCLDILNDKTIFNWTSSSQIYTLQHPGYTYNTIIGVFADNENENGRISLSEVYDVTIGDNETTFTIPHLNSAKKIIVNFSFLPRKTGENFPANLYLLYSDPIKYGALWRMRSYLRPMGRKGQIPDFYALWLDSIKSAKMRANPLPGPSTVSPFAGGVKDDYGTTGGYI